MEQNDGILDLFLEYASGAIANSLSSAILNPMDVTKTRMQVENLKNTGRKSKMGMIEGVTQLYKEGGLIGLWRPGLSASMAREITYSGTRSGLYVPVRNFYISLTEEKDAESLTIKIVAALTTGIAGSLVANPVDVVKIRSMVNPSRYNSLLNAVSQIYKEEGYQGLYKGLIPSTFRGAAISVGEMVSYDHSKYLLKSWFGLKEGPTLHTISSLITGFAAATVAAPFDIIKTRSMSSSGHNIGFTRAFVLLVKEEGIMQLFRGWFPSYMRLGPHALICFPIFEQVRLLFGLSTI